MKKILLAALCIIGVQSSSIAQEQSTATDTISRAKTHFYIGLGVVANNGYNIDSKLAMANLPALPDTAPEFSFGANATWNKWLFDLELNGSYLQQRTGADRVNAAAASVLARLHYLPVHTDKFLVSGGVDVNMVGSSIDIFNDNNVIDLNDLDPLNNGGHVSLRNNMLYVGPSASFGFLQNTEYPLRLNVGYQWALTNGKWVSDFADVKNSVKENGHGRFYAKVILYL